MIVDFGNTAESVGTYPGGQSEDPESPHYADLMPLWATGKYAPLRLSPDATAFPAEATKQTLTLIP